MDPNTEFIPVAEELYGQTAYQLANRPDTDVLYRHARYLSEQRLFFSRFAQLSYPEHTLWERPDGTWIEVRSAYTHTPRYYRGSTQP